jgi:predicted enzyme related to lactoylglutathione lyase
MDDAPLNDAPLAELVGVSVDCTDPQLLASFYEALSGLERTYETADIVVLGAGPVRLGFQRVEDHQPPTWPGSGKQLHLDFAVTDLDRAEREVLRRGGVKPHTQPGGDRWQVYLDPAGHPFCLST